MQLKTILLSAMAATESLAAIAIGIRSDPFGTWNVAWVEGSSPCPAGTNYGLGATPAGCGIPFVVTGGTPGTGAYTLVGCGGSTLDLYNPGGVQVGKCSRVSRTFPACSAWGPGGPITQNWVCA
ncbi:hypothetical protein QBC43DRAFT_334987 [Cladorrhinum sp. PSN259]|nr:hypothetical protein QBC43DRAFT_334987 [Cladorrhinum sp. PSN259]